MKKTLIALALLFPATVFADIYHIDNKHSFANFTIRHVVSKTSGTFSDIIGEIKIDPDHLADATVSAIINVNSLNSSHAKRDSHVKKAKYLDVANYGEMTFVSKKIVATGENEGMMTGDFTMHGVTKEITMPIKVLGFGTDPWGGQRAGFEAQTTIKASDYGFTWMKADNAPVGDEIAVKLLIEGIKAKEPVPVFKDN